MAGCQQQWSFPQTRNVRYGTMQWCTLNWCLTFCFTENFETSPCIKSVTQRVVVYCEQCVHYSKFLVVSVILCCLWVRFVGWYIPIGLGRGKYLTYSATHCNLHVVLWPNWKNTIVWVHVVVYGWFKRNFNSYPSAHNHPHKPCRVLAAHGFVCWSRLGLVS